MTSESRLRARHLVEQDRELRFELVRLREASGVSRQDVALRLGISRQAVAKFERLDADPRLSTIRRYAHAIGAVVSHSVEKDEGQLVGDAPSSETAGSSVGAEPVDEVAKVEQNLLLGVIRRG